MATVRVWDADWCMSWLAKVWNKCWKTKPAAIFRVKFLTNVTVLEHNHGCEKCKLLTKMFGTNQYIEKGLEV